MVNQIHRNGDRIGLVCKSELKHKLVRHGSSEFMEYGVWQLKIGKNV